MVREIIATTLSGLYLKQEPWDKAHKLWYEDACEKLNDNSFKKWINKPDYFKGVDEVMLRLYPDLNENQRTELARKTYFDSVLKYIKQNPDVVNKLTIDYFKLLKQDYRIALITTNTQEAINKILKSTGLESFFDIIETSKPDEKDNKEIVFNRFIKKYGNPRIYIGGNRKSSYDYCNKHNINCLFANFEGLEDLEDVKSVHTLEELKKEINKL